MNQPLVRVSTGSRRWLVRVEDLQEVVPMMTLAQVEGQWGGCRGVLNLRGELIPVFDGNGPEAPLEPSRLILVLREAGGARVGLIVDEAHEVVFLPEQALAPRPVGGGRTRRMALVGEEVFSVLEPGEVAAHGG
ncbi:chemotaxis protein CheW [Cystobacter fuscus]|uniref:chemotaxis protein CheW n=1 Tax=Cystobacter fuscus TaxID=43 RepID=UPI0009DCD1A3|nr:chemotaxis protein CheW [Cystobacter fuscus]